MYLGVVYTCSFLSSFLFVFTHCTAVALATHTRTHSFRIGGRGFSENEAGFISEANEKRLCGFN